ncbi:MAG: trehalase family glycosidase [Candidatus Woesearchaeota archaeon]
MNNFNPIKITPQMFKLKHHQTTLKDLPRPFISASSDYFYNLQFYWDSYFIILGLIQEDTNAVKLAKGMIENFKYLFSKYGYIPNSYPRDDTRTQPPLLTSMILLVYKKIPNKQWLKKMYHFAKQEYKQVWLKEPRFITEIQLSRYHGSSHLHVEHQNAENESGWDFTPRFEEQCANCIALDLNSLLYKYEEDLENIAHSLNLKEDMNYFIQQKDHRKKLINSYLYNSQDGLFYDYNFKQKRQLQTKTLATFFPLFAKLATQTQAQHVVKQLDLFEHKYGLVTCHTNYGFHTKQWNYPNGWAPLQYIAIQGLRNYGFNKEANRLSLKWLTLVSKRYHETQGHWEEKYVVVDEKILQEKYLKRIDDLRYEHQNELYWSQGVFIALYRELEKEIKTKKNKTSNNKKITK